MKNFKTFALFSAVCFLLAFIAGCGGRDERLDENGPVGGSAGSSGSGGSVATGGGAGATGATGGQAGNGGEAGSAGEDAGTPDGGSTASLTVTLATTPVSSIHVKKAQNVPAVGITFTTGDKAVKLSELTVTGQADQGPGSGATFGNGLGAQMALPKDVTLVCLYDGDVIIGLCQAPDSANGKATITKLNLAIPANSSKTLTVKTSLASTVQNPAGDKYALGIAADADVVAFDSQSNAIAAQVVPELKEQSAGAMPYVVKTILYSGELSIAEYSHPPSTIVVGGKDAWVPFAQYKATVLYESATIDRVAVTLETSLPPANVYGAYGADFTLIAVASGGQVRGSNTAPSMVSEYWKDIDLSSNPITVPKDGSVTFELWGKLAQVQAWSAAPDATKVAHSGDTPSINLIAGVQTGEWDPEFENKLNVRTTGTVSGEHLHSKVWPKASNPMVLRKSRPMFILSPLTSNVLKNSPELELAKFQVSTVPGESAGLIQVLLDSRFSDGISVSNLRVYRGSTMMIPDLEVTDTDSVSGPPDAQGLVPHVIGIHFVTEQMIAGSGYVYSIRGTVQGVNSGKVIQTTFWRINNAPISLTGTVEYDAVSVLLDTGTSKYYGTLWSDLSEVPHGSTSADWITDPLVDMVGKTILSAP